ncbi:putative lipoprotein [Archangium gephyra]|nr:putative lipoprotein [Archangium gephyra]
MLPAMKWWGLGAAAWLLGGCVIPQDASYLSDVPEQRNRPPRFVESQMQPAERIVRGYGSDDLCQLTFEAIVEDPDVDDRIVAYWYVDYDPTRTQREDARSVIQPKKSKVIRDDRATFQVNFNSADFNRLNVPGDHIVEVVVTDTALVEGREPDASSTVTLSDGGTVVDPGYTTTYVWFVRTEAGGGCP